VGEGGEQTLPLILAAQTVILYRKGNRRIFISIKKNAEEESNI
jgi:hypothetical protein